jgi:hypothetical protein
MTRMKIAALGAALAAAGATGAETANAWKFITVRKQQVAVFTPNQWACRNFGPRVDCQAGDAYPYVILTSTATGGVTVKVVRQRAPQSGHVIRGRNSTGHPVWTFTAN